MKKEELQKWIKKNEDIIKSNKLYLGIVQQEIEFGEKIIEEIKKIKAEEDYSPSTNIYEKRNMSNPKQHIEKCKILKKDIWQDCDCDGFHTFDELYEHRIRLFIALCRYFIRGKASYDSRNVWISRLHSDGTSFDGQFIMGIGEEKGNQITYHLPISYWDECVTMAQELDCAPKYDGHTPADVLVRLKTL